MVRLGRNENARIAAVTQNRDTIGDLEDLRHVVRDVDDGNPLLLQPADDPEDQDSFLMGQRRRRLVEDHDRCIAGEGTRNLDDALLGDGKPLHR